MRTSSEIFIQQVQKFTQASLLFDSIPESIVFIDQNHCISKVNLPFVNMFGYEESELDGMSFQLLLSNLDEFGKALNFFSLLSIHPDLAKEERKFVSEYKRKDETVFLGENLAILIQDPQTNQMGFVLIISNVSFGSNHSKSHKNFEHLLQRRLDRNKRLYDISHFETSSSQEWFEKALQSAIEALDVESACISLQQGTRSLITQSASTQGISFQGMDFHFGSVFSSVERLDKEAFFVDEKSNSSSLSPLSFPELFDFESFIGIPLYLKGQEIGSLAFWKKDVRQTLFDEVDQDFVQWFARSIEAKIEKEKYLEQIRHLERFFNLSLDLLCIANSDAKFLRINPLFSELLGHTTEELMKTSFLDFIHPDDVETTLEEMKKLEHSNYSTIDFENRYRCADGSYRSLSWRAAPFPKEDVIYAVARDITNEKAIQEKIKRNEFLLNQAGRVAKMAGWEYFIQEDSFQYTEQMPVLFGMNPQDFFHFDLVFELLSQERKAQIKETIQEAIQKQISFDIEFPFQNKNLPKKWFQLFGECTIQNENVTKISGILRDISKQKESEKIKKEFISIVSHELRTPLTSIRGALGLLTGGLLKDADPMVQNLLSIANKNSERLSILINDILDIEKIEAGKLELDLQKLDVRAFLQECLEANSSYATKFEVSLELELAHTEHFIWVDANRLMQVFSNLVSNAIKFSPPKSRVVLKTDVMGDEIQFSIIDQGEGIPQEFQKRLFKKFSQADSSNTRNKEGTGLGLSIAKALTELMKGSISFQSEEGKGSTFFLWFPLYSSEKEEPKDSILPISSLSKSVSLQNKVLIIEDDPDIASLIQMILNDLNCEVQIAYSAEEALSKMHQQVFDILTVDIMLPQKDGISFIKEVRNNKELPYQPKIIVISARSSDAKKELNGSFDVTDCLSKPIPIDKLKKIIQSARKDGHFQILHVEDDDDISHVVATVLKDIASLERVNTYKQAREKIQNQKYDLLLLDIGLPDGSGLNLLSELSDSPNQETSVVFFSNQDVPRVVAEKVHGVFVKSQTSNQELQSLVRNHLSKN